MGFGFRNLNYYIICNAPLIFISVFHLFSKISFEKKHEYCYNYKKQKKIGAVRLAMPIVDGFVRKKNRNYKVCVFKKTVNFI